MIKGVLRNFTKLTGKYLCQSLFLNKLAGLRPEEKIKETLAQVFFCEYCEISKITFFTEHLRATASVSYCTVSLRLFETIILLVSKTNELIKDKCLV